MDKIKATVDARTDADFVIIARSDAIGVPRSTTPRTGPAPMPRQVPTCSFCLTYGCRTPGRRWRPCPNRCSTQSSRPPKKSWSGTGLKVAVYPVQSLFIAYKALRDMVKELRATGAIANLAQRTPSREEFDEFIGAKEATRLVEKYRIV